MGESLPQRAAFTAATDENADRIGMHQHRRLHQGLMVNMLVPLGGLGLAVQDQTAAKGPGFQHLHVLIGGPAGKQDLLYPEHHRQVGIDGFQKPLTGYIVGHFYRILPVI